MICILSTVGMSKDALDVFQKTRIDSKLEKKDTDKAKNVSLLVMLESMIKALRHTSKSSLDCLHITISAMC